MKFYNKLYEYPHFLHRGYRHQINIADSGYGARGSGVHNDRAGEVGRALNANDFDPDRIFGQLPAGNPNQSSSFNQIRSEQMYNRLELKS